MGLSAAKRWRALNAPDGLGLHRVTLQFARELETEFLAADYNDASISIRAMFLVGALVSALSLILLAVIDPLGDGYWRQTSLHLLINWLTVPVALVGLGATFVRATPQWLRGSAFLTLAIYFLLIEVQVTMATSPALVFPYALVLATVFMATCTLARRGFLPSSLLSILFLAIFTIVAWAKPFSAQLFPSISALQFSAVVSIVAGYVSERNNRRQFMLRRLLAAEQQKSEDLLLNVLPKPIADRLKAGESPIADSFDRCTILFADVVGFTQLAAELKPEQLLSVLNRLFTAFDALAERHGLEKIKTIGDAYMAVGGAPVPRDDDADAAAEMALGMLHAIDRLNDEFGWSLAMRIGIASGPVVAGVIGQRKFTYDLWGDTVNTASRMESFGMPGSIQVTEMVYARLRDRYELECRGVIEVKGKGPMVTYLLSGRNIPVADPGPEVQSRLNMPVLRMVEQKEGKAKAG